MTALESAAPGGTRRSILELAPLELDCMNALWPYGEATVRQIQEALLPIRPRAYTTIMTILDRLARKGIVQRRKSGRAWVYRANVTAEEARTHAVSQVVAGFFGGSLGALAGHLTGHEDGFAAGPLPRMSLPGAALPFAAPLIPKRERRTNPPNEAAERTTNVPPSSALDTTLL